MEIIRSNDGSYNPIDFDIYRDAFKQNKVSFSSNLVRVLRQYGFPSFKFYKLVS
jgi:hypothetical protein